MLVHAEGGRLRAAPGRADPGHRRRDRPRRARRRDAPGDRQGRRLDHGHRQPLLRRQAGPAADFCSRADARQGRIDVSLAGAPRCSTPSSTAPCRSTRRGRSTGRCGWPSGVPPWATRAERRPARPPSQLPPLLAQALAAEQAAGRLQQDLDLDHEARRLVAVLDGIAVQAVFEPQCDTGAELIDWLESRHRLHFQLVHGFPDYHPEHPGGKPRRRPVDRARRCSPTTRLGLGRPSGRRRRAATERLETPHRRRHRRHRPRRAGPARGRRARGPAARARRRPARRAAWTRASSRVTGARATGW